MTTGREASVDDLNQDLTHQLSTAPNDYYWMDDKVRGYPDKADSERY